MAGSTKSSHPPPKRVSGRPLSTAARTTGRKTPLELPTNSTRAPVSGSAAAGVKRCRSVHCSSGSMRTPHRLDTAAAHVVLAAKAAS